MRIPFRWRAVVLCSAAMLVFTGFSIRLGYLQITKHEEFSEIAASKNSIRVAIPARRGLITDRNGEILAANIPVRRVVLDGSHVKDPAKLAAATSPYLGIDAAQLAATYSTKSRYKIICHDLPEETALAMRKDLEKQSLRGLYLHENTSRLYPNGQMLAHILGFLGRKDPQDTDIVGMEGIERSMDHVLNGRDGYRHIEKDRTGREIVVYRGQEQGPQHGRTVELTIDMGLQSILENELDTACAELKPNMAVAILANPKTGEILAMASRPHFDPNNLRASQESDRLNPAIMSVVEPGSTFKIVAASAALNEGKVNEKSSIYCENGHFAYGGRILRDHHGYGQMSVREILVKSSNIGSAKMAMMLGEDKYYEYVRMFGFGERTGIDLPGEVRGLLSPPSRWDKLTITRMPMGHSIAVTPLQITMAMGVIANGGKLMRPQLIRTIRDTDGQEVFRAEPQVVRRVIPEQTAAFVADALSGVTTQGGTAKLASVPGYSVAGKTGTAQRVDPKGGYTPGKYVVSFVGFMPAEDPAFVCLVMIDDAKIAPGINYGGLVAAPIFARVGEKSARYLNLVPTMRAEAALPVAFNSGGAREEAEQ